MTNILIVKTMGHTIFSVSHILCASGSIGGLFKLFLNCFLERHLSPENPENRKKIGQVALTYPVLFPEQISLCIFAQWQISLSIFGLSDFIPQFCGVRSSPLSSLWQLSCEAATLGSTYSLRSSAPFSHDQNALRLRVVPNAGFYGSWR